MTRPTRPTLGVLALVVIVAAGACAPAGNASGGDGVVLDAGPPTPASSAISESTASTAPSLLEEDLAAIVADSGVPALGAAVLDRGGPIEMATSGIRRRGDVTAVTADDLFHLGSNTKAMTAALLARLGEQDRGVSFDTTLPEAFADLAVDEGYRQVTLGQLLTHTGGAPGDDLEIDDAILGLPVMEGRALGAAMVLGEPPVVEPGTVSLYSNAGYVIVAAAMEAVTGESWEELMAAELFVPLAMHSCGFGAPGTANAVDQPSGHDEAGNRSTGTSHHSSVLQERCTAPWPTGERFSSSCSSDRPVTATI